MSLMFAKQFSEAGGVSTTTPGKRGGRGRGGGSGLMSKGKRGVRRDQEDVGEAGGLFNMDANSAYRTHMLFPGRKDEDGAEPRRSSGSPSFMKAMMSWGKRPSDAKGGQNSQDVARYRGTPTRATESESDPLDPFSRKTVSFEEARSPCLPLLPLLHPCQVSGSPTSTTTNMSYHPPLQPTSTTTTNMSYHQPYREHQYASFGGGRPLLLLICFSAPNVLFISNNKYC